MKSITSLFSILILVFYSCNEPKDLKTEVFNSTLFLLAEKFHDIDNYEIPPPPPPPLKVIFNQVDSTYSFDTTGYHSVIKKYNETDKKTFCDSALILTFSTSDSLAPFLTEDLEYLKRELPKNIRLEDFVSLNNDETSKEWFNLNTLDTTQNVRFVSRNLLVKNNYYNDKESNIHVIGYIDLSKIYFDKKKKNGIFTWTYNSVGDFGYGEIIIVEKIKNIWVVRKTIPLWIS